MIGEWQVTTYTVKRYVFHSADLKYMATVEGHDKDWKWTVAFQPDNLTSSTMFASGEAVSVSSAKDEVRRCVSDMRKRESAGG